MKSRSLSTEAPSTLTKTIHYSPKPIVQWHCHWHSILGEEKLILGFPFFILPVADMASFLSHSTVSMSAQLCAGHSFCPHEQNPKAHTFGAPDTAPGVGGEEVSELTAWWSIRQEAVAPQGTSHWWGQWRDFM